MDFTWLEQPVALIPVVAVLGLLVGSFLNVVILRLPRRLEHDWQAQAREILGHNEHSETPAPPDLIFKRSHCPHCKHALSALDNIPLLSFLFLRGCCRYCKTRISFQYPLIESISAISCAVIAWKFGFNWQLLAGLGFTWTLIAASGIDARTQLLPDQLTLSLLWLGLLISLIPLFVDPPSAIIGAAIGWLSLWLVFWLFKLLTGKEGMGYGDFKLLAALGAWMGANALLPVILLSSLIGAIIGGIVLSVRGNGRDTPIPFGPFIAAAGWVWFVFGSELLALYQSWFFTAN